MSAPELIAAGEDLDPREAESEGDEEPEQGPNPCNVCGCDPCCLQCPYADPYAGDPRREHEDHEAGAAYDDVRERYGVGVRDEFEGWDDHEPSGLDANDDESDVAHENEMQSRHEEPPCRSRRHDENAPPAAAREAPASLLGDDDEIPF